MEFIKDTLKLDIATLEEIDVLVLKQNNANVNLLEIVFGNDGKTYNLADAEVRVYMILPNKAEVFADVDVIDSANGICNILLKPEYLSKSGVIKAEFIITQKDKVALTKTIVMQVEKSILNTGKVEMSNEYSALLTALNKINVILDDETIYIPGPQGEQGIQGKSAYEVALDNGFTGTQQEWLDSLVGTGGGVVDISKFATKEQLSALEGRVAQLETTMNTTIKNLDATLDAIISEVK